MRYYQEPGSDIRYKVKVVLDFSNYANKNYDTCDLAAKKDFIGLKVEIDKTYINKLVNVPTNLNDLKTKGKVDGLDVGKLKTVPVDLKKLSDVVYNEVVKNTKLNTLKAEVNI